MEYSSFILISENRSRKYFGKIYKNNLRYCKNIEQYARKYFNI